MKLLFILTDGANDIYELKSAKTDANSRVTSTKPLTVIGEAGVDPAVDVTRDDMIDITVVRPLDEGTNWAQPHQYKINKGLRDKFSAAQIASLGKIRSNSIDLG
jgi:hypothetical protein